MGFTFDDAGKIGTVTPIADMQRMISANPRNAERIKPYIGGEEVNGDPRHAHRRYAIDFTGLTEVEARDRWPDLMAIIEAKVKPERDKLGTSAADRPHKELWWQFANTRPEMNAAIAKLDRVLAMNCGATPHVAFAVLPSGNVFAHTLTIFPFSTLAPFTALQSRIHELWARFFASSMKDDLRYTPSDCFETFPFCAAFESDPALEAVGRAYHDHRAALMISRNQGLTKTYNRFHDPHDTAPDIVELRRLHDAMDHAVLAAYGWHDLIPRAVPEFLIAETEDDPKYHDRLFWPADLRDEVLARLLALNAERAATEHVIGVAPTPMPAEAE